MWPCEDLEAAACGSAVYCCIVVVPELKISDEKGALDVFWYFILLVCSGSETPRTRGNRNGLPKM